MFLANICANVRKLKTGSRRGRKPTKKRKFLGNIQRIPFFLSFMGITLFPLTGLFKKSLNTGIRSRIPRLN